ncbi:MAG: SDR family oxidoreductase [Haloechinothrix sp.]
MKVLVTGGAGFIGSHLVERLLRDGKAVRVLDNFSTGSRTIVQQWDGGVELVVGDLRDEAVVRRSVEGVEIVYHLAAQPSVPLSIRDPLQTYEINVGGTLKLLSAAQEAGCRRLVFASSCAVYGDVDGTPSDEGRCPAPVSPYAASKAAGEHLCAVYSKVYGFETVVLRYFNVFGPRQSADSAYAAAIPRFVARLLDNQPSIVFGDGEQSRDFIFVEDVAEANIRAAHAPMASGQTVNIASGESVSLNQLLATLGRLFGRAVEAEYREARPGDIRHSRADVSAARRLLGFAASVPLETGLARVVDWSGDSLVEQEVAA